MPLKRTETPQIRAIINLMGVYPKMILSGLLAVPTIVLGVCLSQLPQPDGGARLILCVASGFGGAEVGT